MQKIKLCGMMKPCDIEYANRVKPDFVGFIFANTRRKISAAQAKQFREALDAEIPAVGVFVNEDISVITSLVQNGCIDLIQLHGEEDADYIRRLREVCDVPVIKAVKVQTVEQIRQAAALPVDYLLLDTYRKGVLGGTGEAFDWELLREAKAAAGDAAEGELFGKPYFLAGGLHAGNLREAAALGSYGLDVSSGIETDGSKDFTKMVEVMELVRKF
ncbi:phosphoribosylanthranilate isomerase [Clostridium sp. AF15-6B]|nr:phosphoribosylanthranilate isomerase [Clostridium sp. AF16-25]RGH05088.1 phosphoribosylanthranilate isomerase [Clostridium sp. AF15-49]RGH11084.1 phosphoribosylanthranilate isomerase [Clostridium sp. AF15-6B]